jgi:hypothetical protein
MSEFGFQTKIIAVLLDFIINKAYCSCCYLFVVHGVEYGFGAHDRETTGIFEVEPGKCPGFTFRKSIYIGSTDMGPKDVREFMEKLAEVYAGNTYHLIQKNCNHFCNDVCVRLTGKSIPRWVNRLARIGKICLSVLSLFIIFCPLCMKRVFIQMFRRFAKCYDMVQSKFFYHGCFLSRKGC